MNQQNHKIDNPSIENYDVKAQETQNEKNEKLPQIREKIISSDKVKKIKDILGYTNNDIYERIVTQLEKYEGEISEENVKNEVENIFSSSETLMQLGISLSKGEINELISLIKKEVGGEQNNDSGIEEKEENDFSIEELSNYSLLKRLEGEGYISEVQIQEINEKVKGKNKNDANAEIETFLKNNLEKNTSLPSEGKNTILKGLSPEKLTEENFASSNFAEDFKDDKTGTKPEFNDFHAFLGENYIKVPDKDGNTNKQKDFEMMFEKSLSKLLEKQTPDFKKTNALLIDNVKLGANNREKYIYLQKLFTLSQAETAKSFAGKKRNETQKNENESSSIKSRIQELLDNGRENAKNKTESSEIIGKIASKIEDIEEVNEELAKDLEIKLGNLIKKENTKLEEFDELLKEANNMINEN